MTLVDPVPVVAATDLGAVHFIAIGGSGMSGVAQSYLDLGIAVSGSDRADSPTLAALAAAGARVHVGHAADQLGAASTVVVSSAIPADNPELVEARRRGLRIWHRSAALAALMLDRPGIAIAGTAGKTTTTAMTVAVLGALDPGHVGGSPSISGGASSAPGAPGAPFVVEADESDGSFLQYPAATVVVTNVEPDHLDNWGSADAFRAGFVRFVSQPQVRTAVLCLDDPGSAALAAATGARVLGYGEDPAAATRLTGIELGARSVSATLTWTGDGGAHPGGESGRLTVPAPGRHTLLNAAAAYTVGRVHGIGHQAALTALTGFAGTRRRFEILGSPDGVCVVDDYAHHPTKVRAALEAGRAAARDGRLLVVFQPHLFSRTRDFAADFATALSAADRVWVLPIYPAREAPIPGVTSALLTEQAPDRLQLAQADDVVEELVATARPGDLVMVVGAGDVTALGPQLLAGLAQRG